jgi:hypothetical protein
MMRDSPKSAIMHQPTMHCDINALPAEFYALH